MANLKSSVASAGIINNNPRQLPLTVELAIVTGFGLVAYIAPQLPEILRTSARVIGPPLRRAYLLVSNEVMRRWEPYNRKRKSGSIIRVIGSILPDFLFEPTGRIFISGLKSKNFVRKTTAVFGDYIDSGTATATTVSLENNHDMDDDVIVAFQFDSPESECPSDVDLDTEEVDNNDVDVSSNPEGWDHNSLSIPCFYPGASSTRFLACSTPTPTPRINLNDSIGTEATDCEENNGKTQEEIAGLKLMIQQLMQQMSTLTDNMSIRHNQTETQNAIIGNGNNDHANFPPPPSFLFEKQVEPLITAPGPPPPPPPPMPASVFQGSTKFQPIKKSKHETEPAKIVPSMSDILKDLPNVKLRSVQRSPGGTPIKTGPKFDDKGSLEFVLKKRFESLHSPTQDSDNDVNDKENNDFDDSILGNEISDSPLAESKFKPTNLFKTRKSIGSRKSIGENKPPFGPHLLRKRNTTPLNVLGNKTTNI